MDMYGLGVSSANVPGLGQMQTALEGARYGEQGALARMPGMAGYGDPSQAPAVMAVDGPTQNFSNDLVVRALNYHGQQLTSFIKETKISEHIDMKNVDYHLYHQRSRELRMEDRGKRLLLHRQVI